MHYTTSTVNALVNSVLLQALHIPEKCYKEHSQQTVNQDLNQFRDI